MNCDSIPWVVSPLWVSFFYVCVIDVVLILQLCSMVPQHISNLLMFKSQSAHILTSTMLAWNISSQKKVCCSQNQCCYYGLGNSADHADIMVFCKCFAFVSVLVNGVYWIDIVWRESSMSCDVANDILCGVSSKIKVQCKERIYGHWHLLANEASVGIRAVLVHSETNVPR